MATPKLKQWFPTISAPLIISAPMLRHAGHLLAAEVTKAGGLGFIGAGFDFAPDSEQIKTLVLELSQAMSKLNPNGNDPLPIGVGFITGHSSASQFSDNALPVLRKFRPAAVWLFAPNPDVKVHSRIIPDLKEVGRPWGLKVFVQVGNVASAREAVHDGADVLVAQGTDAGGHQFRQGCGIVSLVPEVRAMLEEEFPEKGVGLVAAGGISEGKGVAAALALGAEGAVMGTRFIVAKEATGPDQKKKLILDTKDGGLTTLKAPFNDQVVGSTLWGPLYDGRAIIGPLHEKFFAGASVEDVRGVLKDEYSEEEGEKYINNWAGTGVGLVKTVQSAGEIVIEVREAARKKIQELSAMVSL